MNSLSWKSAFFVMIALFSITIEAELVPGLRVKRGLLGPQYGFGIKTSILESLFGKGGIPFAPQPVAPVPPIAPGTLPTTQPEVQPAAQLVTQPPPIFPTFLQNIMQAKMNMISGKLAAKQPPAGSWTLEDDELVEEIVNPATDTKNNILASILKLSGPLSSSSSVEDE